MYCCPKCGSASLQFLVADSRQNDPKSIRCYKCGCEGTYGEFTFSGGSKESATGNRTT